jgi:hypothetical protein
MTQSDTSTTANPPAPRKSWLHHVRGLLIIAAIALAGAGIGFLFARYGPVSDPYIPDWPLLIVGGLLIWLFVIAGHEIGHLIGGRLVGFRFLMIAVGPFIVTRTRDGIRARLHANLAMFGGMAGSAPTDDHDLRRRDAVMVAGGPIASVILAAVCLGLWYALGYSAVTGTTVESGMHSGAAGAAGAALFATGAISFVIALITLAPHRSLGQMSDGKQLQLLLSGRPEGERNSALRLLYGAIFTNQRPREWSEMIVRRATILPDRSAEDAMACFLAYAWALDVGDIALAGQFLDRTQQACDALPPPAQPGVYVEAAYFTARYRDDATTARSFLNQSQSKGIPRHDRLRAEAAVLLAEGQFEAAHARATEGLAALKTAKENYITEVDEEWLQDLILRTAEAQSA